jgi:hypothetical protein
MVVFFWNFRPPEGVSREEIADPPQHWIYQQD